MATTSSVETHVAWKTTPNEPLPTTRSEIYLTPLALITTRSEWLFSEGRKEEERRSGTKQEETIEQLARGGGTPPLKISHTREEKEEEEEEEGLESRRRLLVVLMMRRVGGAGDDQRTWLREIQGVHRVRNRTKAISRSCSRVFLGITHAGRGEDGGRRARGGEVALEEAV